MTTILGAILLGMGLGRLLAAITPGHVSRGAYTPIQRKRAVLNAEAKGQ